MIKLRALREQKHAAQLAVYIDDAIEQVDESMHVKDFATAVATVLVTNYGTHNFATFVQHLQQQLKQQTQESES
jgi:protoheme ferro-lyase